MTNRNPLKDTHFTVTEIAEVYRKQPATIRKWAREGRLPSKKVGKSWLFFKKAIKADLSEMSALDYLGGERMSRYASFDILSGDNRIDVKSSKLHEQYSKFHWVFRIDVDSKKDKENYCDYIFCLCYDESRTQILKAFLFPLHYIWGIKGVRGETISLMIKKYDKSHDKYRVHKLEIPTFIRNEK